MIHLYWKCINKNVINCQYAEEDTSMKTTKRACSLLLALLMMVSLLPAPALAEPAPAFTL